MSTASAPVLEELQVTYPAGTYVFRQGEPGSEMFIIQEGKVEILTQKGQREVLLAVLEEGDFFGEMAVLEDLPRTASARTLTPCQLLRIDRQTFDQLIRQKPGNCRAHAAQALPSLAHRPAATAGSTGNGA
ncbi:MAG: cyclic nucleotide-binding domain-containing protein [Thermoanaerobaculum sp.]